MDLVKGGSLTYSNRHKLRMTQTNPSVIPNDLIIRIIQKGHGGRYGYTHRPQFDRCVDELEKLITDELEFLRPILANYREDVLHGGDDFSDIFHYDGHETEFIQWGAWYQWGGDGLCYDYDIPQGISRALISDLGTGRYRYPVGTC